MHRGPRSIPLCIQYHIQLTSLSFQVSRPSRSWDTAISIFYLENPRSWWGQSSKSQHGFNILLIQLPFFPCQSALPFLWHKIFFKISPWKSKVNVIAEGLELIVGTTPYWLLSLSFDVDEHSRFYIQLFKNLTLKIQGQVMGQVNVESDNMGPTFYRLTSLSFHVNRPSHSWDTTFSKFDLENPRSKLKVTKWV